MNSALCTRLHDWMLALAGEGINTVSRCNGGLFGRTVVVQLDRLGDLVLTVPTVRWLEQQNCTVTLLVADENVELAEMLSPSTTVVGYPSPHYRSGGRMRPCRLWHAFWLLFTSDSIVVLRGTLWMSLLRTLLALFQPGRARGRFRARDRLLAGDEKAHETNQMRFAVGAPPWALDKPLRQVSGLRWGTQWSSI